jgi:RNA polymerase sigma factor (sigma-70 family)
VGAAGRQAPPCYDCLVPISSTRDPAAPLDEQAALAVLLAHRDEFLRFAAARLESRSQGEDLVQDALARALERVTELRDGDAVLGWFYSILRNAIIDHHRRRAASRRVLEQIAAEPIPPEAAEEPRRTCQCVSHVATTLKPEYGEALHRVEVEGVPVNTLAEDLGITPNNAAVRLFRAREALRKKVMTTCRACAEAGCTDCTCGTSEH